MKTVPATVRVFVDDDQASRPTVPPEAFLAVQSKVAEVSSRTVPRLELRVASLSKGFVPAVQVADDQLADAYVVARSIDGSVIALVTVGYDCAQTWDELDELHAYVVPWYLHPPIAVTERTRSVALVPMLELPLSPMFSNPPT